ncbi:hypothetical protein CYMTET_15038 [Cymbomonas tetramitiformis]|uniref:Uncharacterized protein n=1 Tax=Cymbomonas tetramitiformis TaxID=36881 RepID=A0AAE0L9R4_9CHLO|nr:hypothetical protein CYMTET_15038 [Cymbomonas tetramitiformis]
MPGCSSPASSIEGEALDSSGIASGIHREAPGSSSPVSSIHGYVTGSSSPAGNIHREAPGISGPAGNTHGEALGSSSPAGSIHGEAPGCEWYSQAGFQFVSEYIGEVISRELAQRREKLYAAHGLFYLHDVHGEHETTPGHSVKYTIDPTYYGNVGRMLNHSCTPNLTTVELPMSGTQARAMSTAVGLPNLPRVGFFALRSISPGEELTIDYAPNLEAHQLKKVVRCLCGASNCKGWLF